MKKLTKTKKEIAAGFEKGMTMNIQSEDPSVDENLISVIREKLKTFLNIDEHIRECNVVLHSMNSETGKDKSVAINLYGKGYHHFTKANEETYLIAAHEACDEMIKMLIRHKEKTFESNRKGENVL